MNSSADSIGQREDRTAQRTLSVGGCSDRGDGFVCGRGVDSSHCESACMDANDTVVREANSERGKRMGNSISAPGGNPIGNRTGARMAPVDLARIPQSVHASVASKLGEYNARRLRSQREIIRDVMISAAECATWLTLGELRALTRYGEASISAQLRHLRKAENGGYDVVKRHRDGASPERPGTDGRGECVWEYRINRGISGVERGRTDSGVAIAVA